MNCFHTLPFVCRYIGMALSFPKGSPPSPSSCVIVIGYRVGGDGLEFRGLDSNALLLVVGAVHTDHHPFRLALKPICKSNDNNPFDTKRQTQVFFSDTYV